MGRRKLKRTEKRVAINSRVLPATLKQIQELADARAWSLSQTINQLIETGLAVNGTSERADHIGVGA